MKNRASLLGPPLLRLLSLLLAGILASIAHALPSRPSGLHGDDGGGLVDGLDVEQDLLPPAPSDKLIEKMKIHNEAFHYHYTFWNITELDSDTCHTMADQLNREIARDYNGVCTFTYTCNFDSLRYPHWLIFTNCSLGVRCDPDHRSARCLPYHEDVLMLRYIKRGGPSRSTTNGDTTTTGTSEQATQESGEWKLWFVQVPSDCKCSA